MRFAFEAAFLILVAFGAALAQLRPLAIIALMGVAWILVALIERASSREQARAPEPGETPATEEEPRPVEIQPREAHRWLFWRRERPVQTLPDPTAALGERPSRSHVQRLEPPAAPADQLTEVVSPEPAAPAPAVTSRPLDLPGLEEPEPPPRPVVPPPPPRPVARPGPPPVFQPPPAAPPPQAPPPPPQRQWNIWDLERLARQQAGNDPRDEEWAALLMHLREFANADGDLPKEFDGLVRESFAELIQPAGA